MKIPNTRIVIWLPSAFYSAVAATLAEMFELLNLIEGEERIAVEFVSAASPATSQSGVSFPCKAAPSGKMDALILLANPGLPGPDLMRLLERESRSAATIIEMAQRQKAIIAGHCGASYFLADAGLLDGRSATTSWWLREEISARFPEVDWNPSQILIRHGRIFTCGGGFAGLELGRALLDALDMGEAEHLVRKLLVLPPSRQCQSPYEFDLAGLGKNEPFVRKLDDIAGSQLKTLDLASLADRLGLTRRTMARRFADRLQTSPGRWIQNERLRAARRLLETSDLAVAQIAYEVGYEDAASFGRLFMKETGMSPGEYRRQSR